MLHTYSTKRLTLRILGEDSAPFIADFLLRNRDFFSPWETSHPMEHYELPYQRKILAAESVGFLRSQSVRYYLFLSGSQAPIGTVRFSNILPAPDACCQLGYRLDRQHTGCGYMTEALTFLIPLIFSDYQLHRIEAYILPENAASIRFIERMHFTLEGIARERFQINGKFRDHLQYSLLANDAQG